MIIRFLSFAILLTGVLLTPSTKLSALAPQSDTIRFKLCSEFWKDHLPLKGTTLVFQPNNPSFPYSPIVFTLDNNQNCADVVVLESDYLPGTTFSYNCILPDTGHLNGVTIRDICLIGEHILGIEPLPSPYAMIAADANKSGSITTFDIVESRKLMLGIYSEIPNNTSWRSFPDYCSFPNPNNPFALSCNDNISLNDLIALDGDTALIIGTKIGDVDGDATLNGAAYTPPTALDSVNIQLPLGPIMAGQSMALPIKMDSDFSYGGLQIRFNLDLAIAQFDSITSGGVTLPVGSTYYNPQNGNIAINLIQGLSAGPQTVSAGTPHFFIHIKALQNTQLEQMLRVVSNDPNARIFAMGPNCGDYIEVEPIYSKLVSTQTPNISGLRVKAPSPNPFETQCRLEIELEQSELAFLEVVDLTGRVLYSAEKQLLSGVQHWEIPAAAIAPGSLSIWRLRLGAQMVSGKLLRR